MAAKRKQDGPILPRIVLGRPDRQILQDYITALTVAQAHPLLYRQDRCLVQIRRRADQTAVIDAVRSNALRLLLTEYTNTVSIKDEKDHPARVPKDITDMLVETDHPFTPLKGVSRVPVLRGDGSFATDSGYDDRSQMYYDPAPDFTLPTIPDAPTKDDAIAAVALINREVLPDFHFVSETDQANALGLCLTFFVRHAINGRVPMAVIDAYSHQGTGKGLLADVLHIIAAGTAAPITPMAKEDAELRKQITSRAMQGDSVIGFDNVRGVVLSESLEAAITGENWSDRTLGVNRMTNVPLRCTWLMTGNGVQLGGDMPSRTYFIRLDTKQAHAYERNDFTHADRADADALRGYVQSHQGELLGAFMTMVRAWYAAGKPEPSWRSPLARRFGEWERMIAGILEYAGVVGFLHNVRQDMERTNQEETQWEDHLLALHEQFRDIPFTAGEVASHYGSETAELIRGTIPDALREKLNEGMRGVNDNRDLAATRIGKFFRIRADRRFGDSNVMISSAGKNRNKVALWQISKGVAHANVPPDVALVTYSRVVCDKCGQAVPDSRITKSDVGTFASCCNHAWVVKGVEV